MERSGVGYCKSMHGAVRPFERLRSRLRPARIYGVNTPEKSSMTSAAASEPWRMPEPTDLISPKWHANFSRPFSTNRIFTAIVTADPYRLPFAAYVQLLRLMEGADICQNAKNCRRFVEMIEKYYAAHIKTRLDAAAIYVMRAHISAEAKRETRAVRNLNLCQ